MTTSPYDNLPTGKSNRMKYGTSVTTDVSKNIPNTESNPHSSASNPADYANSASSNQTEAADPVISNKAESLIQTETPPNPADTSAPSPKTAQKRKILPRIQQKPPPNQKPLNFLSLIKKQLVHP